MTKLTIFFGKYANEGHTCIVYKPDISYSLLNTKFPNFRFKEEDVILFFFVSIQSVIQILETKNQLDVI